VSLSTALIPCVRNRRIRKWHDHVARYTEIATNVGQTSARASGPSPTPEQLAAAPAGAVLYPAGATRIRFVAGHLDILDRKFGYLLTFHALIATVATLYINVALAHPIDHFPHCFRAFAAVWLVTTVFCLLGFARARWGDIGGAGDDAEHLQVDSLIRAVVTRSSLLRSSVILTFAEILLLVLAVRATGLQNVVPPKPNRIALIGPFSPGVACSTSFEKDIEDAASTIQKTNASKLRIIGGSDAMPVGARLSKEFSNTGLALSRAYCVEGRLSDNLAIRGIHVDATLAVRDATDRSANAEKNGNDADRTVEVLATRYRQDDP
jgi:hypothetical protein